MKKLVIPTDFSPESLQLVEFAILNFRETPLDIVLVHGYRMPEVYWDVLNFSALREIRRLGNPAFFRAKQVLLKEHKHEIRSICIELFTGYNGEAFRNFVQRNEITDALVPSGNFLRFRDRKSFDPTRLIRKHIGSVREIALSERPQPETKTQFSFLNLFW